MLKKLALATAALIVAGGAAQAMNYPLTIKNCGVDVTFEKAPVTAVSIGQSATEILYSLNLGEQVVGTGVWFNEILPEFNEINDKVERLADNDPSFEAIVGKKPGMVAIEYEWHIGPEGLIATREQFHELGIPTYVLPTDCDGKDNSEGIDGTRANQFSTATLYKSISELATVFGEKAKGEALVSELSDREAKAIEKAKAAKANNTSAVFWYSSVDIDADPYVAGQKGAAGYMMKQLGIKNVVKSNEEWPVVGWETIAKADPTFIVIAKMNRRRFEGDDFEKKLNFLKNDPVAKEMTAVKESRIIIMDATAMSPTIRMIRGIEVLTEGVERVGSAK